LNQLESLTELLYGKGEPMPGSTLGEDQAIAHVRTRFPHQGYCLVRDWIWIDLDLDVEESSIFEKHKRQPAVIFAHTVIFDSNRRYDVGDFVRTSPLHSFHDGFLFRTWNSIYVLLGNGVRKRAALKTLNQLFC